MSRGTCFSGIAVEPPERRSRVPSGHLFTLDGLFVVQEKIPILLQGEGQDTSVCRNVAQPAVTYSCLSP